MREKTKEKNMKRLAIIKSKPGIPTKTWIVIRPSCYPNTVAVLAENKKLAKEICKLTYGFCAQTTAQQIIHRGVFLAKEI